MTKAVLEGLIVLIASAFILCLIALLSIADKSDNFVLAEVPRIYLVVEGFCIIVYGAIRGIVAAVEKIQNIG